MFGLELGLCRTKIQKVSSWVTNSMSFKKYELLLANKAHIQCVLYCVYSEVMASNKNGNIFIETKNIISDNEE